jgi:hypothetical protein
MSEGTSRSPVDEKPQPAIGEALLRRVRANRLHAHVICAAASAARQCAKEGQEEARGCRTLACAACVVYREIITPLPSHTSIRSPTPRTT